MDGGSWKVAMQYSHTSSNVSSFKDIEDVLKNKKWVTCLKTEWKRLLVTHLWKGRKKDIKRYGLLFTCLCSRAIHIEMLDDMTTAAFIISLRVFIAIRGNVCQLQSNQGTNFLGAKREFAELMKGIDKEVSRMWISNESPQSQVIFSIPQNLPGEHSLVTLTQC